MSSTNKITNIPHFLSARSPQGLRRLMLRNNVKHGLIFDYKIMFDGSKWYAWYQLDAVEGFREDIEKAEAKGRT